MNKPVLIAAVGIIALLSSCTEKSTDPVTKAAPSFSYESSKCLAGLAKRSLFDSVFVYSFTDTLIIDFSVEANCCPDSNRFEVSWSTVSDTINVSVADTAQNLCRCDCPYLIHAAFANLPNDHYVVRCTIDNYSGVHNPIHLVDVYRKK
jgi:hypothetical protein